ncbi:trypsin-like peptidase domain-containing protein [Streptomyces violaceorubidus]
MAVPLSSLLLATGCSDAGSGTDRGSGSAREGDPAQAAAPRAASELEADYERVIKDVLPSVVQIQAGDSLGSGIVYDDKGHVVTNAHVVGDTKMFGDHGPRGGHPDREAGLLVPGAGPGRHQAGQGARGHEGGPLRGSAKVEVGQIVLAMKLLLGLSSSVTQGIVSATGRTVTEGSSGGGTGATIANMVQTSAAINPGNSGGALVNLDGQVIGIPTLAATDPALGDSAAPGIGFAIPASMVTTVAGQIVEDGKVTDSAGPRWASRPVRSSTTTASVRPGWPSSR